MKQLLHIGLSLLLVIATMGVTLHQHYCGEELQNSGLEQYEGCCSEADPSSEEQDGNCCHNSTMQLKADAEFQITHFSAPIALLPAALPQLFLSFYEGQQLDISFSSPIPHFAEAPPRNGPPYLASLCTLLI